MTDKTDYVWSHVVNLQVCILAAVFECSRDQNQRLSDFDANRFTTTHSQNFARPFSLIPSILNATHNCFFLAKVKAIMNCLLSLLLSVNRLLAALLSGFQDKNSPIRG